MTEEKTSESSESVDDVEILEMEEINEGRTTIDIEDCDGIVLDFHRFGSYAKENIMKPVKIRPATKNEGDKTYLGIYLGELPMSIMYSLLKDNAKGGKRIAFLRTENNPAIYIPELKKFVWGAESWWGFIKNPEEIDEITDEEINNIWYVKMLKEILKEE